jgi:hypothetical protein
LISYVGSSMSRKRPRRFEETHPCVKAPLEQRRYLELLQHELFKAWKADSIGRFLAEADALAVPRPVSGLPDSAAVSGVEIENHKTVKLSAARPIVVVNEGSRPGIVTFRCNRKELQCTESLFPVIQLLNDGKSHDLPEVSSLCTPEEQLKIKDFLKQLADAGVVLTGGAV